MELNREQALDILERFDFFQGQRAGRELWNDKPFDVQEQDIANFSRDVALLKDYIKELNEENERLKSEVSVKRKLLDKAEVRIECVEEENIQLKADICNAEMNLGHITEDNQAKDETITNLIATIKDIQADTVRKMQEKVAEIVGELVELDSMPNCIVPHCHKPDSIGCGHRICIDENKAIWLDKIDQIAKEMLEGNDV